jgi:hypothetical protein
MKIKGEKAMGGQKKTSCFQEVGEEATITI